MFSIILYHTGYLPLQYVGLLGDALVPGGIRLYLSIGVPYFL